MISYADNISYMNGLLSTHDKNRSYTQNKTYFSFSINKISLFGKKTSIGLSPSIENRVFSSAIIRSSCNYTHWPIPTVKCLLCWFERATTPWNRWRIIKRTQNTQWTNPNQTPRKFVNFWFLIILIIYL